MSPPPPVYLYLDFDGVLHPDGTPAIDEYGQLLSPRDPALFRWLPLLADILRPHPEVRIIVSSDWRRLFDDSALIDLLGPLGPCFAGVVEARAADRAQEITQDAARRGLESWVALDDHRSVHAAALNDLRYIPCQPALGVSDLKVQARLQLFLRALAAGVSLGSI